MSEPRTSLDRDNAIVQTKRNKTAIRRVTCSRPLALALADGLITKQSSLFDYGCGHGSDVRYLRARRVLATGWDPHYQPKQRITPADVVNLGYVLNVIEDQSERDETLARAFALSKQVLIVAVRVENALDDADTYGDGVLTRLGTFQKIFSQGEFREYLQSILLRHAHVASLGVAYVFKDEEAEAQYLATRAFTRRLEYRTDLIEEFSKSRLARSYVSAANRLGRLPLPDEFPKYLKLVETFGSPKRIERLSLRHIDQEAFEGSKAQRREDILTYLAMLRLENIRPPGLHKLPPSVQGDVKAIWKNYSSTLAEGNQFLFSLGKPEVVDAACGNARIGKLLPRHLYVHRSAEDELPALLRVVIFAGTQIVGELPYDLVKIAKDGRAISFLLYKDFDSDPHPPLLRSVKVFLPKADFDTREYHNSVNPPILHRKETFVLPTYPHYQKFRCLTEQEESLDLLSTSDIGYRVPWEALLSSRGLVFKDHQVYSLVST